MTNINATVTSRFPARQLVSVRDFLVEDVDRTTPNVNIVETTLWPTRASEKVVWGQSTLEVWNMVV